MYHFAKCMILKVTERLFHHYFICSKFLKKCSSPKAQILRHVQVFFFLYMFLANQWFNSHNFLLCCPSQRSARSQVPSQVATHQKIGSQLWAGETPDSNPGLQDISQALPLSHHALARCGGSDMFIYLYMYWCTCKCQKHENLHDQEKNGVHGRGHEKVSL